MFIQAKRRHYGFDFCPGFWDWLVAGHAEGKVFSIEKIADELREGGDELTEWAAARGDAFFLPPDESTLQSVGQAIEWARDQQFSPNAVNDFANDADAYLVAHAHAHGVVVVTMEVPDGSKRQVKIPNVCVGLNVRYVNPFETLRREKVRFVLEGRS